MGVYSLKGQLGLLFLALALCSGCANQDEAAPSALDEETQCPPLESFMPQTMELLESNAIEDLRHALEMEMDEGTKKITVGLIVGLLEVFPPSRLDELEPLLGTDLMDGGLGFATTLFRELAQMPTELQESMLQSLYTTVYVCPLDRGLKLIRSTLAQPPETQEELSEALGSVGNLVESEEVTAESWFKVLKPLLAILANGADNPEAVENLLKNLINDDELSQGLLSLIQDQDLMSDASVLFTCILEEDESQNDGLLKGISYLLAQGSLDLSALENIADVQSDEEARNVLVIKLLDGLISDPDTLDNLRSLLAWLLEPSRAQRLLPDISTFIEQGALEELLEVATLLGKGNCDDILTSPP